MFDRSYSEKVDGKSFVIPIINGRKTSITKAEHAELTIVGAKTDPGQGARGTSLIFVETETEYRNQRGEHVATYAMKVVFR